MKRQIGKPFPSFKGAAFVDGRIIEEYHLPYMNRTPFYLFFYPLDFTFVCPTEIWAFSDLADQFLERGVSLIAASVDSVYAHMAWAAVPKEKGGIAGVNIPIISDIQKSLSSELGILNEEGVTFRASYFVDSEGIIRHMTINDLGMGRNALEALRIVDAFDHYLKYGEVCPANWQKGEKAITPTTEGMRSYLDQRS